MLSELEEDILRSLRRITRAIDLHSRELATRFGLTAPQLICLRIVGQTGAASPSAIAKQMALSQATVTGIIDRLAARQLAQRERTAKDRRQVTVRITEAGLALIAAAPSPLQERFARHLASLSAPEQERIRTTLAKIVAMMGGEELEAAPLLSLDTPHL